MNKSWKRWMCVACLLLLPLSGNAATPMFTAENGSSLFLASDGTVWGTGQISNYYPGATSPVRLFQSPNIVQVAGGGTAYALLTDGTVWGYGDNHLGQLADGTTQHRSEPQPVPGLSGIKAIASRFHNLALKDDGTVLAWGWNGMGQLGDGTRTDRYVPAPVIGLTDVAKISASSFGSLALKTDGTVWMWGCCVAGNGLAPTNDAERYHLIPTQVLNLDHVIAIAAGDGRYMVLRDDGTVWVWGGGEFGENGTGTGVSSNFALPVQVPGLEQVVAIDARGWHSSLALKSDGTVWAWGSNSMGQLGVSGITYSGSPIQVPGLTDIETIAAVQAHVLAMRRDGTVFAWGSNGNGELGDGTLQDRAEPRAVSGPGGSGQLNLLQPAPVGFNQLPQAQVASDVKSGRAPLTVQATAAYVTDADGTISGYSWKSSNGQQASGPSATFTFTQAGTYQIDLLIEDNAGGRGSARQEIVVSPGAAVAVAVAPKVALGLSDSIALANDGRILTWGGRGMLGLYDTQAMQSLPEIYPLPIANGITGAVDLALGWSHAHVLLSDGTVLGWGMNAYGEVGSGSHALEIPTPQLLPGLSSVKALSSVSNHNLALTSDGRVFAWGGNLSGQLGVGDNENRFQPTEVTGLGNIIGIAADVSTSYALALDGTVWGWGENAYCLFGDGSGASSRNRPLQIPGLADITKIFATRMALFSQKADGAVWVTGNFGGSGQDCGARNLAEYDGVVQLAGGFSHFIALKADGSVWTGGLQSSLALGFAEDGDIVGLKQLPGITDAIAVAAGRHNAMVLRRDGTVLAWGLNNGGQIGDGTLAQRVTPVAVVNETGDGFLDLIPGTDFELPPSVGVPFFVVASGNVTDTNASVYTRAKFNGADVGKSGKVFVTAAVPPGSLVAASSTMSAAGASSMRANSSAATSASSFVLVNLTDLGWKPVTGGQLLPYASGVLGDQLSAQTILDKTDTTNLKGAQFCLGYGASAEQMVATGTMRVVASIPDPNATGVAAATCILAGPPVNYSLALPQGWSLLGNSLNQSLTVSSLFNDANSVTSVWKWDSNTFGWQFYAPSMDATALQTYAASKGYAVLATINPGEGYWVNAKSQPTISAQSGDSFILTGMNLAKGWNLVATGNDITPTEFNANLKASAVPASLTTLWAWDNPSAKWFFYAPSLETQGGTALSGYIANKDYLDFATENKKLGNGTGFWVSR